MNFRKKIPVLMSATPLKYLFRDDFTTAAAAPLASPRTCEPGPGSWNITDTASRLSVADGKLATTAVATAALVTSSAPITRLPGIGLFGICAGEYDNSGFGFHEHTANPDTYYGFNYGVRAMNGDTLGDNGSYVVPTGGVSGTVGFILRSTGCFYLAKVSGLWVITRISSIGTQNLYIQRNSVSTAITLDSVKCAQMGPPWTTDAEVATSLTASAGVGATQAHTADGHVEATWQAVTGQTYELMVRRTDDDNCLIVRCSQTDSTIKLIKKEGGVEVEDKSAAKTWTNGTSYRILVHMVNEAIKVFVDNGMAVLSHTGEAYNKTVTGAKTSHAVTNFICWPYTLTGSALSEVQRRFDPF